MGRLKRRKRRNVSYENKEHTTLGTIVDLPFGEFVKQLEEQKVNIGVNNNLILMLEGTYNALRVRKEAVLNGLYAEMTKLEQKIVYLKERSKKLLDLDNTTS